MRAKLNNQVTDLGEGTADQDTDESIFMMNQITGDLLGILEI